MLDIGNNNKFSSGYIEQAFYTWYLAGKPSAGALRERLEPDPINNQLPSIATIQNWMNHENWKIKTYELNQAQEMEVKEKYVQARVEMLERHSEIGKEMQTTALTWIRENADDLTAGTALRMLVDGVTMEAEALGVPAALKKMLQQSDEELLQEIGELLSEIPAEIIDE